MGMCNWYTFVVLFAVILYCRPCHDQGKFHSGAIKSISSYVILHAFIFKGRLVYTGFSPMVFAYYGWFDRRAAFEPKLHHPHCVAPKRHHNRKYQRLGNNVVGVSVQHEHCGWIKKNICVYCKSVCLKRHGSPSASAHGRRPGTTYPR